MLLPASPSPRAACGLRAILVGELRTPPAFPIAPMLPSSAPPPMHERLPGARV